MAGALSESAVLPPERRAAGGLRRRLLAAFVLVSVVPVVALALLVSRYLVAGFERRAETRLSQVLDRVTEELATRRSRAEARVRHLANEFGASPAALAGAPDFGSRLARDAELPALEVVDASGRLLASHHWPAGVGLADDDVVLPGDRGYRWERVGLGYGVGYRLALMARATVEIGGESPAEIRGGEFLDESFLAGLSGLLGVELALFDTRRDAWITSATPPLDPASFSAPGSSETHHSVQRELAPSLLLLAAEPRSELAATLAQIRSTTALLAAAAFGLALAAAFWLSRLVARPVLELAEAARRISRGEPGPPVPERGGHEVAQLGRAFNRMTRQLAESRERLLQAERVAAWREMARRLAHELKNPLFPIQLSIETLRRVHGQREGPTQDPEFDRLLTESTDTIVQELGALRGIVDEFSQFARMPRPRLAAIDVRDVARHVVSLYAARMPGVRVETRFDDPLPDIAGDRDLLSRALGNLVKNALEAVPEGGGVRVSVSRRDDVVCLAVEDDGPGLEESHRTRLFTPDYTTKEGGTGLGLPIVQGIVSDHGGRIEVESRPGAGTRFAILLPLPPTAAESLPPAPVRS